MPAIRSDARPSRGSISIPKDDDSTLKSYSDYQPLTTDDDDSWATPGTSLTLRGIPDHRKSWTTSSCLRTRRSDEDWKPQDQPWHLLEKFDSSKLTLGTRSMSFPSKGLNLTLDKAEDGTYMSVAKTYIPYASRLKPQEMTVEEMTCTRALLSEVDASNIYESINRFQEATYLSERCPKDNKELRSVGRSKSGLLTRTDPDNDKVGGWACQESDALVSLVTGLNDYYTFNPDAGQASSTIRISNFESTEDPNDSRRPKWKTERTETSPMGIHRDSDASSLRYTPSQKQSPMTSSRRCDPYQHPDDYIRFLTASRYTSEVC